MIWVRFSGDVLLDEKVPPLKVEPLEDGKFIEIYKDRQIKRDGNGHLISQFLYTTVGRIIFNKSITDALVS